MARRNKSSRRKNPIAVGVVAAAIVVLFLIRLYQFFGPLLREGVFDKGISGPLTIGWRLTTLGRDLLTSAGYLALSLAGVVVLWAFLRLRRWSWVLLMAWTGASLVVSLATYFYGKPNYLVMASNVIIAFALNIPEVQRVFGIRRENAAGI